MNLFFAFFCFGLLKITSTNPVPKPTFDCLFDLIDSVAVIAGAASYGGALGPGFSAGYPYGGVPYYGVGGPYYGGGGPYYGGSPYYGGTVPSYGGTPYYGGSPYYGGIFDYDY